MADEARARRRTRLIQRYLLRRTVVGYTGTGTTLWVVAERHAGLVRKFGTSLLSIRIDISG